MKIIIETDSKSDEQTSIRRVTSSPGAEQVANSNLVQANLGASVTASPVDAGHARVPDGYSIDSSQAVQGLQQFSVTSPGNTGGAIDAGAARAQQDVTPAVAMPDTGGMETVNKANAFSGGAFATSVNN